MKQKPLEHITESGFQVPDNFFDTVTDTIMAEIEKPKSKVIRLTKYKWLLAMAASVLIFIGIYSHRTTEKPSTEEIMSWIDQNDRIDSYDIAEAFQSDISQIQFNEQIDDKDIENYLEEQITEEFFYN